MCKLNLRVLLSDRCNHRCAFCSRDFYRGEKRDLDEQVLFEAIRTFAALGGEKVTYSGGEPLMSPLLYPAMRLVHSLGMKNAITTNGSLLGRQSKDFWRLADSINISMPAFVQEAFSRAVGAATSLETVKENAVTAAHMGLRVKINSVYLPDSAFAFERMVEYFAPHGIVVKLMNDMWGSPEYYAGFLRYAARWKDDPRVQIEKDFNPGYGMCANCKIQRNSSCPSCRSIWLYPDGSITLCPFDTARMHHCATPVETQQAVEACWCAEASALSMCA